MTMATIILFLASAVASMSSSSSSAPPSELFVACDARMCADEQARRGAVDVVRHIFRQTGTIAVSARGRRALRTSFILPPRVAMHASQRRTRRCGCVQVHTKSAES